MSTLAPSLFAASASYSGVVGLHTLAVIAWLATVVAVATWGGRARVAGPPEHALAVTLRLGRISRWAALPGSIITLLAGGWLLHDGGYSLTEQWWIGAGLGAWIICFFGSTMGRGSEAARIGRLAEEKDAEDEDVQWRIQRLVFLARGETVLLLVAIALMYIKPN